ncbi:hypothetical protein [Nocardioides albidus]|uniref:hypothetical protein n=1 Tax=Nocardioides albidus TaxID=1517589 RepID=UPI00130521C0|nr:hypothetical protein [Nocardioides albidus]
MSVVRTQPPEVSGEHVPARVREQAAEALKVMAFSVTLSLSCVFLLVMAHLADVAGR